MDKILLGQRIKEARALRDFTLDELATTVGLNKSTISRYERGEIDKPKLPVIDTIANALHVNPSWLVGKSDDKTYTPRNMDHSLFTPCNMFASLKRLREEFGYSPEQVAFKIGISKDDYLSIENGRDMRCIILVRLAELFCCSTDYILSFDGILNEDENIKNAIACNIKKVESSHPALFSEEEMEMIRKFRCLKPQRQASILNTINFEYDSLPGDKANATPKEA